MSGNALNSEYSTSSPPSCDQTCIAECARDQNVLMSVIYLSAAGPSNLCSGLRSGGAQHRLMSGATPLRFFFSQGRGETRRVEGTGPARPGAPAVGARGAQHRLRQGRCLMRCPSGSLVLPYRLWTIATSVHFVIQRNSCLISSPTPLYMRV